MSTFITAKYSESHYYQLFYSKNRNARLHTTREHYSTDELIKADSNALKKAAKELADFDYSDDNGGDIYHALLAFKDTYNNALDSSGDSSDHDVARLRKAIKNLTDDEKENLAKIGITIKSNGSLEIDEDTLQSARLANVKKVFSDSHSFTANLKKYAQRLYKAEFTANLNSAARKSTTDLLSAVSATETAEESAIGQNVDISL